MDVIATAYFAHSTELTAEAAQSSARKTTPQVPRPVRGRSRQAFNKAYVAPDGRIKGNTQTCYVLALAFDLLPPKASRPRRGIWWTTSRPRRSSFDRLCRHQP